MSVLKNLGKFPTKIYVTVDIFRKLFYIIFIGSCFWTKLHGCLEQLKTTGANFEYFEGR